jgi:hypothetical protein
MIVELHLALVDNGTGKGAPSMDKFKSVANRIHMEQASKVLKD